MLNIKDIFNHIKWFIQKIKRGYSDPEWWNLDTYLCNWILPRLIHLRDHQSGYPCDLDDDSWYAILTQMIIAFAILEEDDLSFCITWRDYIEEGLQYFARYFGNLWD